MKTDYWLSRGLFWGFVFGLGAAGIIYRMSVGAPMIWCIASDNGGCFREWVSALSGWAAAAVAVPTLFFLRRQVRIGQMQAHDAFQLELRRSLAIARNAKKAAIYLKSWYSFHDAPAFEVDKPEGWRVVKLIANDLNNSLNDDVFKAFEREIAFPSTLHFGLVRDNMARFMSRIVWEPDHTVDRRPNAQGEWVALLHQCYRYGTEIELLAEEFIKDSGALLIRYR